MTDILLGILIIIIAYLLGTIPFGLIITKYAGLGDVRNIGSGNIGATNVLRTGKKKLALATLFCDIAKGAIAVIIAKLFGGNWVVWLSATAAVLGHVFPVWLKFKGGKGVATTIAVYWFAYWPLGLFTSAVWLSVFFITRISSLSSLMAAILTPVIALFYLGGGAFLMTVVIGGVVIYRHKENIIRLMKGEEKSFGKK